MMKKILLLFFALLAQAGFSQGSSCAGAEAFCAGSGGLVVPNTTAQPNSSQIACLGSQPNASWFYLQIDEPGNLVFQIVQNTSFTPGGVPNGTGLDVDFVAWGPFDSVSEACNEISFDDCPSCPNNTSNPNFYPFGNIVDCSYDSAHTETMTINNAQSGEIYMVLLTNFNGSAGFIKLIQTNSGQPGAGSTDCSILCPLSIVGGGVPLCSVPSLTAIYENAENPTFQ